jgi:hypothetical protein
LWLQVAERDAAVARLDRKAREYEARRVKEAAEAQEQIGELERKLEHQAEAAAQRSGAQVLDRPRILQSTHQNRAGCCWLTRRCCCFAQLTCVQAACWHSAHCIVCECKRSSTSTFLLYDVRLYCSQAREQEALLKLRDAEHQAGQLAKRVATLTDELAVARAERWDAAGNAEQAAAAVAAALAEVSELRQRLALAQQQAQQRCACSPSQGLARSL